MPLKFHMVYRIEWLKFVCVCFVRGEQFDGQRWQDWAGPCSEKTFFQVLVYLVIHVFHNTVALIWVAIPYWPIQPNWSGIFPESEASLIFNGRQTFPACCFKVHDLRITGWQKYIPLSTDVSQVFGEIYTLPRPIQLLPRHVMIN